MTAYLIHISYTKSIEEFSDFSLTNPDGNNVFESLVDEKKIRNIKQIVNETLHPVGHSFESVAELKKKTDENDRYLIYKVIDNRLNGERSYVMKSSELNNQ